jgi:O-antigen/teichoic acid export membrane protein
VRKAAAADEMRSSEMTAEYAAPISASPTDRARLLRNLAALASAQTAERFVSLFGAIYVRRVLAVAAIGQVSWTASLVSYFTLVVSPGFQTVAKRDVARDPTKAAEYASMLLSLQLLLAAAAYAVVFGFSHWGWRGPSVSILLLLQGINLFILPVDVSWILYARERMGALSVLNLVCAALQTACLFLFVRHPHDVYRYVLLPLPFRLLAALFAVYYASTRGLLHLRQVRLSLRGSGPFLKTSLPIGLSMATVLLYYNFDNVLLGFMRGDHAVGIYSTAYSLMLVPTFLNTATFNAYFPQLARVSTQPFEARRLSAEVLRNMTWIGCSLAFLGWAAGRHVVTLIFGFSYFESGRIFEWLCLDLILVFFNMAYNQPLVAWNHQRLALRCTMIGAAVNVSLNLLLIPPFGSMGAVVATILAEVAVLLATVVVRRKVHPIDWWEPLLSIGPLCLVTGLLAKALLLFAGVPLLPVLALGCAMLAGGFLVMERQWTYSAWTRLRRA